MTKEQSSDPAGYEPMQRHPTWTHELHTARAAGISDSPKRLVDEDSTERLDLLECLRDADHRRDQFIATLGHELRNPLAPVRYAAKLLHRSEDPAVRRAATIIDRQVDGMAALLDKLLDVSRISHGLVELKRESVDLRELVQAAAEDARPWADSTGLQLTVEAPDAAIMVSGDRVRLKQVLDNLLNNAIKFTSGGGHVRLALDMDGGIARLRVADDGIGIPAEMLTRIFEPLVQVRAGSSGNHPGGLGIGLALVRNVMALHGGDIRAESAGHQKGATFILSLPTASGPAALHAASGAASTAAARPGLRPRITDDHPDAVELAAERPRLEGLLQ
ncbi:HAMP domain-containing histidine kinase [Ramlibacter sp. AW1]|uniref:histidine kinase n=1 Tax=Ramlibacter aurantiacus TaxID=2801330 RepID=A0A937D2Y1_9BURK|nr:HAMP domain-containing sensor histidine kinase [Ramlibacter aurantiacus]MBL0422089.1 HAMP domain-containing histidine kinase [Ramlibacter aurantiacus]